jgi:hypothetical protein
VVNKLPTTKKSIRNNGPNHTGANKLRGFTVTPSGYSIHLSAILLSALPVAAVVTRKRT